MKRETNALHEGLLGAQLPWERRWARRGGVRRCCCLICRCNLAPGVAFGSLLIILNSLFLLWFAGGFAFDPNHGFVFRMITFFQFMAALALIPTACNAIVGALQHKNLRCLCSAVPVFEVFSRLLLWLALMGIVSTAFTFIYVGKTICNAELQQRVDAANAMRRICNLTFVNITVPNATDGLVEWEQCDCPQSHDGFFPLRGCEYDANGCWTKIASVGQNCSVKEGVVVYSGVSNNTCSWYVPGVPLMEQHLTVAQQLAESPTVLSLLSDAVTVVDFTLHPDSGNATVAVSANICAKAARQTDDALRRQNLTCEWMVDFLDIFLNLLMTLFYWHFAKVAYSFYLDLSGQRAQGQSPGEPPQGNVRARSGTPPGQPPPLGGDGQSGPSRMGAAAAGGATFGGATPSSMRGHDQRGARP